MPDLNGVATPLPGVVVTALPYDRDSLLSAMEQRAGLPRPHTQELDTLFQAFRTPFLAFARVAWRVEQLRRTRDSLATRRVAAAGSPAIGELDGRLHATEDSLRQLEGDLNSTRAALAAARNALWPRIERLRGEVQRWELTTFAGYDTAVRSITRDRLVLGLSDTTDANAWVRLVLTGGRWWIYARSPDPQDPNAHWYWNVAATGDTLRLTASNARHLPRY